MKKNQSFSLFYKYLLGTWIVFSPGIVLASAADGKAMEGAKLYQKKEFNQASEKFFQAYKGKPDDPKISYNLGNSLYKQGEYEKALQNYTKSLAQKSSTAIKQKTYYNMGNVLFRMDKHDESIAAYKKSLEIDPADMDAKFNLEFVREQARNKKKDQSKSKKNQNNKNNHKEKDPKYDKNEKQATKQNTKKTSSDKDKSNFIKNKKRNEQQKKQSENSDLASEKITKEKAEQRLSVLQENLKQFQRKQALEMKSLFNYQGNDW